MPTEVVGIESSETRLTKLTPDVIAGFVASILSKRFDESTESPAFHREVWELCCLDHQHIAIAAPRGHAKSTAGTLAYGLAEVLFRSSRYVVIVSDTETQATMFVQAMAQELMENDDLIELFGVKKNDQGKVQFLKQTEADIIVQMTDGHTFRIMGKGAEQKLRGMLWNGMRPDLVLIDDLENDELVMNKERREKLKRWFNGALLPMASRRGKFRMFGTILHMDSVLENLMPPMHEKWTVEDGLKIYSTYPKRRMWKSVKYKAHTPDFSLILWPERFTKEKFQMLIQEARDKNLMDLYSQEYLNNPIDESIAYFKRGDFLPIRPEDESKKLNYYITVDPAISEESKADFSVFCIAGVDEDRTIVLKSVIRERLDGKEIVDLLLALERTYEPEAIGIEKVMITQAIGPFLREEMIRTNTYPTLVELSHQGKDKEQRARNIQARMRARMCRFDKQADWYSTFEDELLRFPRGVKDDQVDAWAYMGKLLDKMIEAPTKQEDEEEEFWNDARSSGNAFTGRSAVTGY
jgi:predicted phage terminase large subunit-like protein